MYWIHQIKTNLTFQKSKNKSLKAKVIKIIIKIIIAQYSKLIEISWFSIVEIFLKAIKNNFKMIKKIYKEVLINQFSKNHNKNMLLLNNKIKNQ